MATSKIQQPIVSCSQDKLFLQLVYIMIAEEHEGNGEPSSTTETDIIKTHINSYPIISIQKEESDFIKIGQNGSPAVLKEQKTFCQLFPLYLWLAFKQPHIIYFIVQSIFQYFKFCQTTGEIASTSVLVGLILICIAFEIHAMASTYTNYTLGSLAEHSEQYQTWNNEREEWELTELSNLKEGQIIIVNKYYQSNPILNPTNILPIAYCSKSKHMLIKTTRIDKREQYRKISLLNPLYQMVQIKQSYKNIKFDPKLFSVRIDYRFISYLGETFEAQITFPDKQMILITNEDMVPSGISISTEDYVIGIILKQVSGNSYKNAQKTLLKSNSIVTVLSKYLILNIWINIILLTLTYITNFIITQLTTSIGGAIGQYSYCYIINFISVFMNSIYISMYILIYIQRIYDVYYLKKQLKVSCQNRVRTVDQLAQTDTLIMDDFFFLERPYNNDDFRYELNNEAPLTQNINILLKVIEESTVLRQQMSGHIIPIIKYFRLNNIKPQKSQRNRRSRVKILKEQSQNEGLVQIKIKVTTRGIQSIYMLRFNDTEVISTVQKIKNNQFKTIVNKLIEGYKRDSSSLLLFIEIMKLSTDLSISNQFFVLYGLISFSQTYDQRTVEMLKEEAVLARFNVVIMTNKTRKYIEYFMGLSGMMKSQNHQELLKSMNKDDVIVLDEKEQGQIYQTIKDYRKMLRQRRRESRRVPKQAILLMNSTMITYLSRQNIRSSLLKLTAYCKYIVFYNCSQFQKQICAASLFKIFPGHLFMSNYLCDYAIFQWSNLSISEQGASAQMLASFIVPKYDCLKRLVMEEAIKSVQMIHCIVNSHIFKNQFFLGSNLLAFYLMFQGGTVNLIMPYFQQIMIFYNFFFTLAPVCYMIFKRPQLYIEDRIHRYIKSHQMIGLHIYTLIFGIITCFIAYALIQEQFIMNLPTTVMIMSVFAGNIFVLYLDYSTNKTKQIIFTFVQIILAILFIIGIQIFQTHDFKLIYAGTNFDISNHWFYLTSFLILPFFITASLIAASAGRQIRLIQNQRQLGLRQFQQELANSGLDQTSLQARQSESCSEIVIKMPKGAGKGLRLDEYQIETV